MTEFLQRLPQMIREKRKALSISQEKLAELVGVTTSFIGQVERGESLPSVATLFAFVQCLNLDVNSLFFGADDYQKDIDEICNLAQQMDDWNRLLLVEHARLLHKLQSKK
jgi:transcriptional regulator with XRE-family HTH domain